MSNAILIFIAFIRYVTGVSIENSLTGLHQNDPYLIQKIKSDYLIGPQTEKPYNFTDLNKNNKDLGGQFGQATEIAKLFNKKKNGFFIEAGAYDGEVFSNTLLLEAKYNWTGILVEPNPDAFEELHYKNRKSYSIETCLSMKPEVTEVTFDVAGLEGGIANGRFRPADDHQKLLAIKKKENPNFESNYPYERRQMQFQCLPLTSIIKALGNPTVDYLSLDIEGAELQVLRSINFDEVDIKIISIESNHLGEIWDGTTTELKYLMSRNGYEFYKKVEIDDIYIKKGFLNSRKDEL